MNKYKETLGVFQATYKRIKIMYAQGTKIGQYTTILAD